MSTTTEPAVPISAIPAYIRNAAPVPAEKRAPWYMNTAPTYAGIFLWIAFYQQLGVGLSRGTLLSALVGVILAGAVCHFLFYYIPGLLGMKTGLPLYIVGTSTFGTTGGYFIPGIFMGLLQIGWYSVATYFATTLIIQGLGLPDATFYPLAIVWGVLFAIIGALGIGYVARMSQFFPIVPIVMLIIGAVMALPHLGSFDHQTVALPDERVEEKGLDWISLGSLLLIQLIVGFFGTAGAVGADFCSNNRNETDVKLGGYTGIWLAIIFAAGLAIITVAGAHGASESLRTNPQEIKNPDGTVKYKVVPTADPKIIMPNNVETYWAGMTEEQKQDVRAVRNSRLEYGTALRALNTTAVQQPDGTIKEEENWLASIMLILFAIGSMAPACFCSFIIGNSLSTMFGMPRSRIPITLAGAGVGIAIALTGAPAQLAPIFGLVGASFGPVIGAMIADYFMNGSRWSGPREGINFAGYGAWLVGFLVGISNNSMVTNLLGFELVPDWHPTGVYSLVVGCVMYIVLARLIGLPAVIVGAVRTEPGKG
jgi:cytosine permease